MTTSKIRNFVIIAHIDHGKSTLADRMLELTHTVESRRMRAQYLDQMELEQERGITIKMAPVRMLFQINDQTFILNLIDTPGHSDFAYEVSRALEAVEGAILLVDALQGIQAQTLANYRSALDAHLTIIPAVNKIDLNPQNLDETLLEIADLLHCEPETIHKVSGKTGQGVKELLESVVEKVPPPRLPDSITGVSRALIFDSHYNDHKGVIAAVRVFEGEFASNEIALIASDSRSKIKEYGHFMPGEVRTSFLSVGEIGYIATGIKDPHQIRIGDTVIALSAPSVTPKAQYALPGYRPPRSVVFVSCFPEEGDEFEKLERALERLRLNDSAVAAEPDQNEILGRGFKLGFLGRLHFEIAAERLRREFGVRIITTFPSVLYRVRKDDRWQTIVKPEDLPAEYDEIWEPMVKIEIMVPSKFLSPVLALQGTFRMREVLTHSLSDMQIRQDRVVVSALMPLAELVSDFDDQIKSSTEGYASFSYDLAQYEQADIVKVDILLTHRLLPGMSRFFPRSSFEREARKMVERLKDLLPKEQWPQPVQAESEGRIIARETIPALRKDVTGYLYGGDRSRKMKLWKKQKRGKKNLLERASQSSIEPQVFKELLKK